MLLQVEPANRPSAKQLLSIPPVNEIMKDFLAEMKHMQGQNRKESLESPAILRKRDQSFRYDVRFDLTMQDIVCEGQSVEAARSQIEAEGAGIVVPICCMDPNGSFAAKKRVDAKENGEKHESLSMNKARNSVRKQTDSNFDIEVDKRIEVCKSKENTVACFAEEDQRKRTFVIKSSKHIGNQNACNVNMRTENRVKDSADLTGHASRHGEASIKDNVDCHWPEQCDDITTCINGEQTVLGKRKNSVAATSVHGTKVRILRSRDEGAQGSCDVETIGSRTDDTVPIKPASHICESVQESKQEEIPRNYDLLEEHNAKTDSKCEKTLEERRKSRSINHVSPRFRTRVLSRIRNVSLESVETCKKVGQLQVRMSP